VPFNTCAPSCDAPLLFCRCVTLASSARCLPVTRNRQRNATLALFCRITCVLACGIPPLYDRFSWLSPHDLFALPSFLRALPPQPGARYGGCDIDAQRVANGSTVAGQRRLAARQTRQTARLQAFAVIRRSATHRHITHAGQRCWFLLARFRAANSNDNLLCLTYLSRCELALRLDRV